MTYYLQFHNGVFIFGAKRIGVTGRGKTVAAAEAQFLAKMRML